MKQVETLIIGGGISGLACGRALAQSGREFVLCTDRLGGRLYASADGLNYGAAYVTPDYHHVLPFVDKVRHNRMRDVYYWDGRRMITVFHPTNVMRAAQLARIYALLVPYRKHLNKLRERVPHECQKSLMERDPVLRSCVEMPASELVAKHGLERMDEIFCGPLLHSTLFVTTEETNAFYWMANLFPALIPAWTVDVRPAVGRLTAGFRDRIVNAKVTEVRAVEGGNRFEVKAGNARYSARNLVVAIPRHNSEGLVDVPSTTRSVPYCTIHIRGQRRSHYRPGKTVFLRREHPIRCLWPQNNGADIAFGPTTNPDLSEYYENFEITGSVAWKTACQIAGAEWRPLRVRENLFAIGDHNILGLEDSYLTGLFAANRILETPKG